MPSAHRHTIGSADGCPLTVTPAPHRWQDYKSLVQRWFPGGIWDTKHLACQLPVSLIQSRTCRTAQAVIGSKQAHHRMVGTTLHLTWLGVGGSMLICRDFPSSCRNVWHWQLCCTSTFTKCLQTVSPDSSRPMCVETHFAHLHQPVARRASVLAAVVTRLCGVLTADSAPRHLPVHCVFSCLLQSLTRCLQQLWALRCLEICGVLAAGQCSQTPPWPIFRASLTLCCAGSCP